LFTAVWVVAVVASSRSLLRGLTVAHGDGRDGKLAPAERLADLLAVIDDLGAGMFTGRMDYEL